MNDAAQVGWAIGPLPVVIACLSLFFVVRLILVPASYNRQYDWCAFGLAPGLVAAIFFMGGVRSRVDITPFIQVLATLLGVGIAVLLLAVIRRMGNVEFLGRVGIDAPPLFILASTYITMLVFFFGWIAGFHLLLENIEIDSCNRRCRGAARLLGSPSSAFTLLWAYMFFVGFMGFSLVFGAIHLARRVISGPRSWWE